MNYSVIFRYSNRERKFARSSTAVFDKRYDLLDSVDDMFQKIVSERK